MTEEELRTKLRTLFLDTPTDIPTRHNLDELCCDTCERIEKAIQLFHEYSNKRLLELIGENDKYNSDLTSTQIDYRNQLRAELQAKLKRSKR